MESLSARQYLGQLREIDAKINRDLERLEEMKAKAFSGGAAGYGRERVQASLIGDKLCSDVSEYVDFNEEINAKIDSFIDAKWQIISEISKLRDSRHADVLYKIYVQYKSIRDVAQEMGMSYSYTAALHNNALQAFEEAWPERYWLA